ncbi:hypothetical protein GQX73_g8870 [Xylaria multiplex]|uniref:EKC/KEOPS complex subunit BUD32 n=1 Tax=Xylaria multiplex TaxID=323545 RepID=A0A7C8IIT3_9PEZI|nr:hypothetical protein GQX73_g8870 [Xylaria multiplex]
MDKNQQLKQINAEASVVASAQELSKKRVITAARKEQNRLAQRAYRKRQKEQKKAQNQSVISGPHRLEPRRDNLETLRTPIPTSRSGCEIGFRNSHPIPPFHSPPTQSKGQTASNSDVEGLPTRAMQPTLHGSPCSPAHQVDSVAASVATHTDVAMTIPNEPTIPSSGLMDTALGVRGGLEDDSTAVFRACVSNAICIGIDLAELMYCERPCMSPFYRPTVQMNEDPAALITASSHDSLPVSLRPTLAQILVPHHASLDLIPLPRLRERAILMCAALPHIFSLWEMKLDIYTRNALICHGSDSSSESISQPWDTRSWQAAPWFLSKWKMVIDTDEVKTSLSIPGIPGLWIRASPTDGQDLAGFTDKHIRHVIEKFAEWGEIHGPIYSLMLGSNPLVMVQSQEIAKELLDKRGLNYSSRPALYILSDLASRGLRQVAMKYNVTWRQIHRVNHKTLNMTAARAYGPYQILESRQMLIDMLESPDQYEKHIQRYSNSVACQMVYGFRTTSWSDPKLQSVVSIFFEICDLAVSIPARLMDCYPILQKIPRRLMPVCRKALDLDRRCISVFLSRWLEVKKGVLDGAAMPCFCKSLVDTQATEGFSEELASYIAGDIVEAASSTTSDELLGFLMAMVTHPDVQQCAQREIDAVIGQDRIPRLEDMASLPYVRGCVRETLQWMPTTALLVPHSPLKDDVYQDHVIPSGASVVVNVWALNMDPKNWPNPHAFDPLRFKEEIRSEYGIATSSDPIRPRHNYVFGAGRRLCQGIHIAEQSLFLAIACLIWAFDITTPDPSSIDTEDLRGGLAEWQQQKLDFLDPSTEQWARVPDGVPLNNDLGGTIMAPPQVVDLADADDDDAQVIYHELQSCFARSNRWECEKLLGSGAYGAAVLVKERNADQGHARRVVLKRALGAGIDELKAEIAALKLLRGSAHFATMLASCEDLIEFANQTTPTMGLRTIFATLHGLRGPASVQEFCQNGTLDQLKEKARARGIEIPNSLLWHFYLCLVRACIGLAYPPSGAEDVTPALEVLRGEAPGDLVHGDIAGRNIVIADIDADVPEHSTIPTLKMIDLGSSRHTDNAGKGPEENLHAVAIRTREDEGPKIRDDVQRSRDSGNGHPTSQRGTEIS